TRAGEGARSQRRLADHRATPRSAGGAAGAQCVATGGVPGPRGVGEGHLPSQPRRGLLPREDQTDPRPRYPEHDDGSMTMTSEAPRRRFYWQQHTDGNGSWLSGNGSPPGEDLAALRRGIGRPAGSVPQMWRYYTT